MERADDEKPSGMRISARIAFALVGGIIVALTIEPFGSEAGRCGPVMRTSALGGTSLIRHTDQLAPPTPALRHGSLGSHPTGQLGLARGLAEVEGYRTVASISDAIATMGDPTTFTYERGILRSSIDEGERKAALTSRWMPLMGG
jgi:hypothetical protein